MKNFGEEMSLITLFVVLFGGGVRVQSEESCEQHNVVSENTGQFREILSVSDPKF